MPKERDAVRRGTTEFNRTLEEFRDSYVDAHFPGLTGYAFRADTIDVDEGKRVMETILKMIMEIDWPEGEHPMFKVRGESKWRSADNTEDFPQPTDEPIENGPEDEDEDDEEEEEEDDEEEDDRP